MKLLKRRHAPGQAPGSLPTEERPSEPGRLRLIRYSPDTITDVERPRLDDVETTAEGTAIWLDLEGLDIALISDLGARLGIHSLALEDVVNTGQRPKMEDYDDSLFFIVDFFSIAPDSLELNKEQVSLVLGCGSVLSVREHPGPVFEPVRQRLHGGKRRIRTPNPDYLTYALMDTIVDHLFPALEQLGDAIEETEDSLLDDPQREDLNTLHQIKRNLLVLRKSAWPMRDMLSHVMRSESPLIGDETRVYLRDVADHVALAIDIIETYREMVSSLVDLYLSSISNRMNEIMKVLTIIATIFIPLSFVAGLYGMNFDTATSPLNMPELHWYWGYPAALGLMLVMAGGLLIFFRRRRWI